MRKLDAQKEALFYKKSPDAQVQCVLCPRNCIIKDGQFGYCGVRKNIGGILLAASYGRAAHLSEEVIETEAVFHMEPGSRILSLGNVGCNLSCLYCQNWKFSQIQHADDNAIFQYTPQQVVDTAIERGIKILSWTYNDPAVWIEFVLDTAKLARKQGLYNLFKSAMFLNPEPVDALMEVMDVFTISVKSVNLPYHLRFTKGWPEPIMAAVKKIYGARRHHLEISNLVVTDGSDSDQDFMEFITWMKSDLGTDIPTHFVCFHPAYEYLNVSRTPDEVVIRARQMAKDAGLQHVYVGNVFMHEALNTYCQGCGSLQVERIGLNVEIKGLVADGLIYRCAHCHKPSHIKRSLMGVSVDNV